MHHVHSHVEKLANECADHAAALGAFGLVSNQNNTRWAHFSFDTKSCFATSHNLGDVLEKLRDVRTTRVSASSRLIRSWRVVLRRVSSWLVLLVSSSSWSTLFSPLGSIFSCASFFFVEDFGVQWKGQTLRLSLPLRTLLTSMNITFGIPCWSSCFTCRLAPSSKYMLKKLIWRENRFLEYHVSSRVRKTLLRRVQTATHW